MMPVRNNNQNWFPSIFNDFFDNDWVAKVNTATPAVNVIEDDKCFKVEVAAPGMTKEDFSINLNENDELVISMEKKNRNEEKDDKKVEEISASRILLLEIPAVARPARQR